MIRCVRPGLRTYNCHAPYGWSDEMSMWICLGCYRDITDGRHTGTEEPSILAYSQMERDDWDDLLDIMQP